MGELKQPAQMVEKKVRFHQDQLGANFSCTAKVARLYGFASLKPYIALQSTSLEVSFEDGYFPSVAGGQ